MITEEDEMFTFRKANCELGLLTRSDGSAIFTLGDTAVLASVYGPCDVKPQKLLIDRAAVEVIFKPKSGMPSVADKLKESTLRNVCEAVIATSLHPRTSITIIVQEMQDSGGLLACALNATCLALMDTGLPMNFLLAGVCCMVGTSGEIILDPNSKQMRDSQAVFTLCLDSVKQDIISSTTAGSFTAEEFSQVISHCRTASKQMFQLYRDVVKKYAQHISIT